MKTPFIGEEFVPARSYGLIETVGLSRTEIDRDDDGDYWEDCREHIRPAFDNTTRRGKIEK